MNLSILRLLPKFLLDTCGNVLSRAKYVYIVEQADWVISRDGSSIVRHISKYIPSRVSCSWVGLRNSIIHFATINTYVGRRGIRKIHPSNAVFLTWYHLEENDSRLKYIDDINRSVDYVCTSCSITRRQLIKAGIKKGKILTFPIGYDHEIFTFEPSKRKMMRKKLGLTDDAIVIGSFQKDGVGWDEGNEPKMIKGPDIFCDVVESLAHRHRIAVLLTGPSRGYVKNRLQKAQIPFVHSHVKDYADLAEYYHALDFYLVSSRAEGGPKSVLEAPASGIPLVSTKVGMVADLIRNGENGVLSAAIDSQSLARACEKLIQDVKLRKKIITNGLKTVKEYTWKAITDRYYEENIKPLRGNR